MSYISIININTFEYIYTLRHTGTHSQYRASSHGIPCQIWTRYMPFHYGPAKPVEFKLSIYYHFMHVLSRAVTSSHHIPCLIWTRCMLFHYTPAKPIDFQLSICNQFMYVLSWAVTSSHDIPCQICYSNTPQQNQLLLSCQCNIKNENL